MSKIRTWGTQKAGSVLPVVDFGMPTTKERGRVPLAILGSTGLLFFLLTLFVGGRQAAFVLRASRATATYQGSVAHAGGSHGGTFLYPRLQFTTSRGETIRFTGRSGSTSDPYTDAQQVPVLYDPSAPNHASIDSFWQLWGGTVFVSVFALAFLGIPLPGVAQPVCREIASSGSI